MSPFLIFGNRNRGWDLQSQSVAGTSCPRQMQLGIATASRHVLIMLAAFAATTLTLAAQQRTLLDFGHLDLDWRFSNNKWSVKAVWDDDWPIVELEPHELVLVAKDKPFPNEGSRTVRNSGSQWDFIGVDAGQTFWRLPADARDYLVLEPGFSTNSVSGGPGGVRIDLVDVAFHGEGVGHFSVYTGGDVDNVPPTLHMHTTNGIDANDSYLMGRGDHRHVNWAFSAKGVYEVSLTASMLTVANDESSRVTSDPQTFIFAVGVPHMELWLLERGVAPSKLGEADAPAGDGVPNLLKYALGLSPLEPVGPVAQPTFFEEDANDFLALDLALNPHAKDLNVWVQTSQDLADWQSGIGHTVTLEQSPSRIHVRDAVARGNAPRRFIRLAVERDLP